jgi:hypothetical protein
VSWTAAAGFALVLIGAALGLAQLWLRPWDPETFAKLMITVGVLLAIDIAWGLVQRERRDTAKTRDRKRLD